MKPMIKLRRFFGNTSLFSGGRRNAVNNEDESARSTSRLRVVFALCVGVIQGMRNAPDTKKSIYLDKVPVQRPNGTLNFPGVRAKRKVGTANQGHLPGFSNGVGIEQGVNVTVTQSGGAVTRSVTAIETDAIWVRVTIQMSKQTSKGTKGEEIQFRFSTKSGSDPFVVREDRTIRGAFYQPVEFAYELEVNNPLNTVSNFQVRCERITADVPAGDAAERQIKLDWVAFTPVSYDKYGYPHTAVVGVQIPSYHFTSQPDILFNVDTKRVLIPNNAVIDSDFGLTFTGQWSGAFTYPTKTCDDPAWILYDLLTNVDISEQLNIKPEHVNFFDLYACSVYNNQFVPTGNGSFERRYQMSFNLTDFSDAKALIDNVCSAMHAKIYDYNGQIRVWQDRPGDVKKVVSRADVAGGRFVYSGSTRVTDRATDVYCDWIDGSNFGARTPANYADQTKISRYGYKRTDIEILGLGSQYRANRFCRWFAWSQWNQDKQMTCGVRPGIALGLLPGDIIEVADEKFSLTRIGGIIAGVTPLSITLDSPLVVTAGMTGQQLTVMLPDGKVETKPLSLAAGSYTTINYATAFSQTPLVESTWSFKSAILVPTQWRVINKLDNLQDPSITELQCIAHNPNKYTEIEYEVSLPSLPTRLKPPDTVTVPSFAAARYRFNQNVAETRTLLIVVWSPPVLNGELDPFTAGYMVQWSADNIEWQDAKSIPLGQYFVEFDLPYDESYYARVAAIDMMGRQSDWVNTGVATLGGNWHPDTIIYQARVQAVTTISTADTDAIDVFVRLCYLNGLREAGNPSRSKILDCIPYAGNGLNGVKLWSYPGSLTSVTLTGFVAGDWSRAKGLNPGSGKNKYANTEVTFQQLDINDFHWGVYLTGSGTQFLMGGVYESGVIPPNGALTNFSEMFAFQRNKAGTKFSSDLVAGSAGGSIYQLLGIDDTAEDAFVLASRVGGRTSVYTNDKVVGSLARPLGPNVTAVYGDIFYPNWNVNNTYTNQTNTTYWGNESFAFHTIGKGLTLAEQKTYNDLVKNLVTSLGRDKPSITTVTLHPDTQAYLDNLATEGILLTDPEIQAIDNFVNQCYSYGFRDAVNPVNHVIIDCVPFAGSYLNGVKLWSASGSSLSFNNKSQTTFSREKGVKFNGTSSYATTGVVPSLQSNSFGNTAGGARGHLCLQITSNEDGAYVDAGCQTTASNRLLFSSRFAGFGINAAIHDHFDATLNNGRCQWANTAAGIEGIWLGNRFDEKTGALYKWESGNTPLATASNSTTGNPASITSQLILGAFNDASVGINPTFFSPRSIGFYSTGRPFSNVVIPGLGINSAVLYNRLVATMLFVLRNPNIT